MLEDFRKFALRGNVVDLAIGVIIGAAFSKIVDSLVGDVFMPVIGALTGGLDFSNYYTPLASTVQKGVAYADAKKSGAVLGWGNFMTVATNFLIVAWVLFWVVRLMNRLQSREDKKVQATPAAPELPADVKLLAEIRDLLAKRPAGP